MKRWMMVAALAACGNDAEIPVSPDAQVEPDPLAVDTSPVPGSLDDLHARVIEKRCSGQPGLCHNGQFEPNLSTPGLTYAYLVNRPAIEKPAMLRVRPGSAAQSVFIDKIRNRGVATQMPLGAEPLPEAEIAELEAWIDGGALRAPGAAPAPTLNNPPKRPQIGVFSSGGARLDGAGAVFVSPGTTLVLRHTVQDFETPDAAIPFAAVLLQAIDGRNVVLAAGTDPQIGPTTFDAAGPPAQGDVFDFRRTWAIGSTIELIDPQTGTRQTVPAAGQTLSVLALYIDSTTQGIVALDVGASAIQIQ